MSAVQEVHVCAVALKYNITGMVRNVSDGSVEVFTNGSKNDIAQFEKEINVSVRSGPQVYHIDRFVAGKAGFKDLGNYNDFIAEKSE